jgi:hypothetical protein
VIPLPYRILAGVLLWLASVGGAFWWAYGAGKDACNAQHAKDDKRERDMEDRMADAAAKAIKGIEVQRVEIIQPTQTTTREVVRYRECKHEPSVLRNVNSALTGTRPAGRGELPASAAAGR